MNNKQKILLFNDTNNTFIEEKVIEITENKIETKDGLYSRQDFEVYFDESNNTLTYISNIDIAAKIEAENLKKLRRSQAINNIFDYETSKQFDLMSFYALYNYYNHGYIHVEGVLLMIELKNEEVFETAQDVILKEILQDDEMKSNETLDLLKFMQYHSTPITNHQFKAMMLLNENGLEDITALMFDMKPLATPQKTYMQTIEKLTMADRIKGNAKLSHLMKSEGNANPAGNLTASDMQAQGMSRREIDRY